MVKNEKEIITTTTTTFCFLFLSLLSFSYSNFPNFNPNPNPNFFSSSIRRRQFYYRLSLCDSFLRQFNSLSISSLCWFCYFGELFCRGRFSISSVSWRCSVLGFASEYKVLFLKFAE